jgi:prolyl-tRNA synthetase
VLWSRLFIPTLREAPGGISAAGGRLLARAGFIRGEAHLFLGQRSLSRIARIIREEMDSRAAQEIRVPAGPWMLRLAHELRSYKQLPQIWFQFHGGFEACSFGIAPVSLVESLPAIFRRCQVEVLIADSLGGVKFVVPADTGEDFILRDGAYIADLASAKCTAKAPATPDPEGDRSPEPFPTPNRKTITELADFTGLPETSLIKSLVLALGGGALVMVLLRGDHQLSETKLAHALNGTDLRPATAEEIRTQFGAGGGSLGPVGVAGLRILADESLRGRRNMIGGANRDDYHLRYVTPGEDFVAEYFDLRQAAEGDTRDGEPVRLQKALALGSAANPVPQDDLHVTDDAGQEVPLSVGRFSISLDRTLWAAAEQHHDPDGLVLPPEIAPFDLIVTPVDFSNQAQRTAAENLANAAGALGLEVLIDDRDERPGVKFKDADLIGVPWRVTVGKKLEQGIVEVVDRRCKQKTDAAVHQAVEFIRTRR